MSRTWTRYLAAAALSAPLVGDPAGAQLLNSLDSGPTLRVIDAATSATVSSVPVALPGELGSANGVVKLVVRGGAPGDGAVVVRGANRASAGMTSLPIGLAASLPSLAPSTRSAADCSRADTLLTRSLPSSLSPISTFRAAPRCRTF